MYTYIHTLPAQIYNAPMLVRVVGQLGWVSSEQSCPDPETEKVLRHFQTVNVSELVSARRIKSVLIKKPFLLYLKFFLCGIVAKPSRFRSLDGIDDRTDDKQTEYVPSSLQCVPDPNSRIAKVFHLGLFAVVFSGHFYVI